MDRIIHSRRLAAIGLGVLTLLALMPNPARADKLLRWKFVEGDQRRMEMSQDVTVAITRDGRTGQMKILQAIAIGQTVEDVDDQGNASITQKFEHIKMSVQGAPEFSFTYDSASTEEPKGGAKRVAPIFQALSKAQFTSKISPKGEIIDVIVPEDLVKFAEQAKQFPGLSELYSKEGLTQMMKQSAALFPEQPVEKGDQWNDKVEVKNPTIGTRVVTTSYTYEGEAEIEGKKLDKLGMSIKIEFIPGENGESPVTITDQTATGELLFDAETGQLVNGDIVQRMKMEANSQGKKIQQDITTKTVIKVTAAAS